MQEVLDQVLSLYEEARRFIRDHGNPDQWGNVHPPAEMVQEDIRAGKSYVCVEDGKLLGVFYFANEVEPDYAAIYQGAWLNDAPYGVMHRVACPGRKKGTASFCVAWCLEQSGGNLRIDTHEKNLPMQGMLAKNGFTRCGLIRISNGEERVAYHKCCCGSQEASGVRPMWKTGQKQSYKPA